MAVVATVLFAGKAWLVWQVADVAPLSARMLVALRQDVLLVFVLAAILMASALPRWRALRLLGEITVALAVVANCVLVLVAREVNGLVTADVDAPATWEALRGVLEAYGSIPRYVALLLIGAAFWIAPALAARPARLGARWIVPFFAVGGPMLVLTSALGTAAASANWADDRFEVGAFRDNPLVHYAFAKHGFADVAGTPASLDDISRALAPLTAAAGGKENGGSLEELADRRFNVVLVVLESAGATAFDFESAASERHPFLSRVKDRAVRFNRYSSPAPNSAAALAAIHCSQLRLPIGLEQNGGPLAHCRPLARLLEAGGVRTAFFQSTFVGDWISAPFFDRLAFGTFKDASRVLAERSASGRPAASRNGVLQEHETVTELLGWVDERCTRREPFFGVYYSWAAHAPYPLEHAGRFAAGETTSSPRGRHRLLVRMLDEQIERIHDALAAGSCGRPTALLVTGDHGEAFGEHPGNRYHVMHVYEENVAVPLLVMAPGLTGRVVDRVASHIDLAPTVVDLVLGRDALATLEAPESPGLPGRPYQGRSLLRPAPPRPVFSVSLQGEGRASIRFGSFKLIATPRNSWLFDTDADPGERNDLSAQRPDLARALRDGFGGWMGYQLAYEGRS